jgi:hypothetical protein
VNDDERVERQQLGRLMTGPGETPGPPGAAIGDNAAEPSATVQQRAGRTHRTSLAVLLPSVLAIALIGVAFGMTTARVVALEIDTHPPVWVLNAIPAALSELTYGHPKRYTSLTSVHERFFDSLPPERNIWAKSINLSIRKAREIAPSRVGTEYVLLGPDDKGIVDLIELSFMTFGYAAENVTLLYFVMLLASCLIYVAAFWRSPSHLLLAATLLAMLYLLLPMVAFNGQLRSILALRALPVLSMVACLHCLLFMAGSLRERVSVWQIGLVALQIGLIAFTIHLRATTIWQIMTIVGFGILVLIAARFRPFGVTMASWRSTGLAVGATIGLAVAGYLGVQAYHAVALPEEYRRGDEIATRVFWHNIFSGLAFHPDFAERYQLRIDDASVFAAMRDYLTETGRYQVWLEIGGEAQVEFRGLKFAKYDPLVRELLIARCSTYVRECAEAMLYYKPVALAGNLAWLYGLQPLPPYLDIVVPMRLGEAGAQVKYQYIEATQLMDEHGQRAYLWTPLALLVIAPFVVLLALEPRRSVWAAFAACIALVLGSTIPTVVGYPVPHTILEPAMAFGMVTYFVLCFAAATWLPRVLAHRWPRQHAAEAPTSLSTAAH